MWWMTVALLPEPDLDALTRAADQGQDLSGAGCLVVSGDIALEYRAMGVFHDVEQYALQGRLVDGVWQDLELVVVDPGDPNSEIQMDDFEAIPPLLGRRVRPSYDDDSEEADEGESPEPGADVEPQETVQPMAYVLDALRGEVSLQTVRLGHVGDQEAYVLERSLGANNRRGQVEQEVWVLPSGQVRRFRTRADHARGDHGMVVRELEIDQHLSAAGLPEEERISFKVRYRGIPFRMDQTTTYRSFVPCGEDTSTEPTAD